MVKLIGNPKVCCAVFISGRGTNLKSIINYSKKKKSKIYLKLVISNKSNASGSSAFSFAGRTKFVSGISS